MHNSSEKILIRGVNWIGDAVMTLPAVRALRIAYRGASMSQLLKPSVAPLFEKDPNIDDILIYEERFRTIIGRINLANILRKQSFAKAILLQNAFDAALLAFLAGIPERIGYNRDKRGFMLTKSIQCSYNDRKVHHIDYYLNLLRSLGIKAEYSIPYIFQSIEERIAARELLSKLERPILGINPGAAYGSAKRWLPERFADIVKLFIRDIGGSAIIFGGKNEERVADEIQGFIISGVKDLYSELRVLNFAGKTSLRQLIGLISECDALITNDSGPMHISYAVGTPLVAIFGSTSPELTGPPEDGNIVIKGKVECSPCFKRKCPFDNIKCMQGVSVEDVFGGLKKILPLNKAVFFDRDGTLCEEADYLRRWEDFRVFAEIHELQKLKDKGFYLIGLSNQSGVGRGFVEESFVQEVNRVFIAKYYIDDFYYCPHHPDEHCSCRKPELAMLNKAKTKYLIDFKSSYVVGDKDSDMLLAKAIGAKGVLVMTGKQKDSAHADYIANNLSDAVDYILK